MRSTLGTNFESESTEVAGGELLIAAVTLSTGDNKEADCWVTAGSNNFGVYKIKNSHSPLKTLSAEKNKNKTEVNSKKND